jgi:ribonuclease T2
MKAHVWLIRPIVVAAIAGLFLTACGPDSGAQADKTGAIDRQTANSFDFYVLALSWSPSYCAASGDKADRQQCGPKAKYAFIVHGLWPQYEKGYPENCPTDQPKSLSEALARRYEDLTPSGGLIRHEWQKHGTCSGLAQTAYFEKLRSAREKIAIPREFENPDRERRFSPQAVENAFVKINKGLKPDGIAVTCDRRFLREVRICLTKDLAFRSCAEIDRDRCSLNSVLVPMPE